MKTLAQSFESIWTRFDGCRENIVGHREIIVAFARLLIFVATLANVAEIVVTYADVEDYYGRHEIIGLYRDIGCRDRVIARFAKVTKSLPTKAVVIARFRPHADSGADMTGFAAQKSGLS